MLRDQFPIFESKRYLNSCSQGALSLSVKAAYHEYLQDWESLGAPWDLWLSKLEEARSLFAQLINAEPAEIAVTTSVSAAVGLITSALDFSSRSKLVVSAHEFPTIAQNCYAQTPKGATVVQLPANGPGEDLSTYIDSNTALVALAHICYRSGARQDIKSVRELTQRQDALLLLDAYQSLGTMPLDVRVLGVDILVGGSLKYLLGSPGLAFMYVRKDLIPDLNPHMTGWFAQEDIMALNYRHQPARSAKRFESGTPAIPNIYAAIAGLKMILGLGTLRIERHLHDITTALKDSLSSKGFKLATSGRHGALIAVKAQNAEKLVRQLETESILCSSRDNNLRISPHFYNNLDDIDWLMDALQRHRDLLVT